MGPASLPLEIRELMTTTVQWESFQGFDGHAEPSYAAAIPVSCWQEAHGYGSGGLEVFRKADGTVVEPIYDLYFSGDDQYAKQFQLYDRFLISAVGIPSADQTDPQHLQAVRVDTLLGPPFDNRNPWLIIVTL